MKKRKNWIIATLLAVGMAGGVATWTIATTQQKRPSINQKYLQAFFSRYVAALNSKNAEDTMVFYSPGAISVGAWGVEMNNAQRLAYFACCKQSFPDAQMTIKKVTFEPTSETSGRITWEFGIRAGKQVYPFFGIMGKNSMARQTPDDSLAFDHEGVSIGEVEVVDNGSKRAIRSLQNQITTLYKQLAAVSGESTQKNSLIEKRAMLDQQLTDLIVPTIKFTRQTSMQNMDAFLKKLRGE
jgi:hypothetical protein